MNGISPIRLLDAASITCDQKYQRPSQHLIKKNLFEDVATQFIHGTIAAACSNEVAVFFTAAIKIDEKALESVTAVIVMSLFLSIVCYFLDAHLCRCVYKTNMAIVCNCSIKLRVIKKVCEKVCGDDI